MKVEAIIEQADSLTGQEIEVEGTILIIERAKRKIAFVSSSPEISEKEQQDIFIEHSLAELKTIIRPLLSMQLMFRGVMTNPPYFYRFPATFRATFDMDADNTPILKRISQIELTIPYTGKTSEVTMHDSYHYSAQVDYTPRRIEDGKGTARAVVASQKRLLLVEKDVEAERIPDDENRYARRVAHQVVRVSGWLESVPSKNDLINHMIFSTSAVRASMVAVGPLREMTLIWLRPSPLYKLLRAHIPIKPETPLHQAVEIVGQIDYLQDEHSPGLGDKTPKLVFTDLYSLIIHEEAYLW